VRNPPQLVTTADLRVVTAPHTPPNVDGDRLTLTVGEAANMLGISRAQAYRCVRSGELKAVQLGRRIVIPKQALNELLSVVPPGASST
jgi:excisionase family DNA binding protein